MSKYTVDTGPAHAGASAAVKQGAGQLVRRSAQAFWGSGASYWVVVGGFWLTLFVYCMGNWVLGPDFVPNHFGMDKAPASYVRFIKIMDWVGIALTLLTFYIFVLKDLIRDHKLSPKGLFYLACGTLVLQEPWHSWIRPYLLYNDIFINYGSWMGYLPGIVSPVAQKTPLPIFFAGFGYFYILAAPSYCGYLFMRWLKQRVPGIGNGRLVFTTLMAFFAFDFTIEAFITRTGMFVWQGTPAWLTVFAGQPYQFPIWELWCWGGEYTFLACFLYFRNEDGEMVAERGLSTLPIRPALRTFVRWVACVGLFQTMMLGVFNVPYYFASAHGDKFTITEESHPWLTAGLCGTSTPYDCAGPGVPIARRDMSTNRIAVVEHKK